MPAFTDDAPVDLTSSTSTRAPSILWLRRDLRLHDHPALTAALAGGRSVVPLYVLDEALLAGRWASPNRAWFLAGCLRDLGAALEARGGRLLVLRGRPADLVPAVARAFGAEEVHVSRDYAPYGRRRDRAVAQTLAATGRRLVEHPGVLIREPEAIRTRTGGRYAVFTPFRRTWEAATIRDLAPAPAHVPFPSTWPEGEAWALQPATPELAPIPTAQPSLLPAPGEAAARQRLARWLDPGPTGLDGYAGRRNLVGEDGTSRLSADLRWGTLSPLEVLVRAVTHAEVQPAVFTSELAWRDFYAHLLWWEPHLARDPFDPRAAGLAWRSVPDEIAAWRAGQTGYPIVDAAMRQLLATGWMHNRARMIVASFLAKDLFVDWRIGEAHFMAHLVDGDPAANNGGWQWSASTGADAQPWFRVFNPTLQGERFDPDGAYVRRWVPELARVPVGRIHRPWTLSPAEQATCGCRIGHDYPAPIVDHADGRARALAAWSAVRASSRD